VSLEDSCTIDCNIKKMKDRPKEQQVLPFLSKAMVMIETNNFKGVLYILLGVSYSPRALCVTRDAQFGQSRKIMKNGLI